MSRCGRQVPRHRGRRRMSRELLQKLAEALRQRGSALPACLAPGLPEKRIRSRLARAGIVGAVEPIVELFAWHDGWRRGLGLTFEEHAIAPGLPFVLQELDSAIACFRGFPEFARKRPAYWRVAGSHFPLLWDGDVAFVAVDIRAESPGAIVVIDQDDPAFVSEAHASFEELLQELVRANATGERLDRLGTDAQGRSLRRPIQEGVLGSGSPPQAMPRRTRVSPAEPSASTEALLRALGEALTSRWKRKGGFLRKGGSPERIRARLDAAGIAGDVDPLVDLYAWADGQRSDTNTPLSSQCFLPGTVYSFLPLRAALEHRALVTSGDVAEILSEIHPEASAELRGFVPILWDQATGYLGVDVRPESSGVIMVDSELCYPGREVCPSLRAFLADAIEANKENEPPSFLDMVGT